jgi:phosphoserine phosphatase
VIATELDFKDSIFTGKLLSRNCYGIEKVKRIQNYLATQAGFIYSYGYGNSVGDYELLDFVDEGYFISGTTMKPWNRHDGAS